MASSIAHARDNVTEPASGAMTRQSALSRSVTTIDDEVARLEQALLDIAVSSASSVGLVQCASDAQEAALGRELIRAARQRDFVTARLSLQELALDAPEELVAHLLDALTLPDDVKPKGVLRLLDRFFERHGKRSVERFDAAVEELDALGDLAALCRAYLAAEDDAHREVKAFDAWASGTELKRRLVPDVRGTLDARSAQRALGELTRIIRALGHSGLLLVLQGGGAVTLRTSRQRERSYTVLRELVDNFDAGRGALATRIVLTGDQRLFESPRGIRSLAPLLARLDVPGAAEPPPPHRSCTSLVVEPYEFVHRRIRQPEESKAATLRSLIRISQGLPPTEAVASMSVGHERIDRTIDQLFEHAEASGSVCQVLVGDYGSGKTHIMLHLAERALAARHPVFWLNLERMNLDLGSPEKHLGRLLAQSVLPLRQRPSALDRAAVWTRTPAKLRALTAALEEIAQESSEEAISARKALASAQASKEPDRALEAFLSATDLAKKGTGPSYRQDAYRRLLLWLALLRRMEGCKGPVILIDEAENLYTTGMSHTLRRAAMRTLAFYCGGAVPEASVVLAMTPPALVEMRKEVASLLEELDDVASTLPLEDVDLFRRRLRRLSPEEVPEFSRAMRLELAERVRATHRSVRGAVAVDDWQGLVARAVRAGGPPRSMIRQLVDELEAAWWAGN